MGVIQEIQVAIQEAVVGSEVHILDPRQDGVHLEALVIAEDFDGKTLIEQHQMVMLPLKGHFQSSLHALGLKTFTPGQWELEKEKYQGVIE